MDNMQDTAKATAMDTVGMVTGVMEAMDMDTVTMVMGDMDTVDMVTVMGTDMDIIMVMADIITEKKW